MKVFEVPIRRHEEEWAFARVEANSLEEAITQVEENIEDYESDLEWSDGFWEYDVESGGIIELSETALIEENILKEVSENMKRYFEVKEAEHGKE